MGCVDRPAGFKRRANLHLLAWPHILPFKQRVATYWDEVSSASLCMVVQGPKPLRFGSVNYFYDPFHLEHARKSLLSGFNVSETANSVGYASLSHFISEFKRHFGKSPKAYAQGLRDLHLAAIRDTNNVE